MNFPMPGHFMGMPPDATHFPCVVSEGPGHSRINNYLDERCCFRFVPGLKEDIEIINYHAFAKGLAPQFFNCNLIMFEERIDIYYIAK